MNEYVLVVDDDDDLRALMSRELSRGGHAVVEAATVGGALEEMERLGPPRAVVSDLNLGPGGRGDELLAIVEQRFPGAARLLVSGSPGAQTLGAAHEFLGKPWSRGQLLATLTACLAGTPVTTAGVREPDGTMTRGMALMTERIDRTARILVVDDNPDVRNVLAAALADAGYATSTCASAGAALSHLADAACDLVLSDVRMPGGDGFGLLRSVRTAHPAVLFVLMTAQAAPDDPPFTSADAYLPKPVTLKALLGSVARLLARTDRDA